jgi:hypothetical protein
VQGHIALLHIDRSTTATPETVAMINSPLQPVIETAWEGRDTIGPHTKVEVRDDIE